MLKVNDRYIRQDKHGREYAIETYKLYGSYFIRLAPLFVVKGINITEQRIEDKQRFFKEIVRLLTNGVNND